MIIEAQATDHLVIEQSMKVFELAEPFDFDTINESTARSIGQRFLGDESLLLTAPKPIGKQQVQIHGFSFGDLMYYPELATEMTHHSLTPNPWHLIAYMSEHPELVKKLCILTQWQDTHGNFYSLQLGCWEGIVTVVVSRNTGNHWSEGWYYAGSKK